VNDFSNVTYDPDIRVCAVKANARFWAQCVKDKEPWTPTLPEEINKNVPEDLWDYFVGFCLSFGVEHDFWLRWRVIE
jgi:hypothetical protein